MDHFGLPNRKREVQHGHDAKVKRWENPSALSPPLEQSEYRAEKRSFNKSFSTLCDSFDRGTKFGIKNRNCLQLIEYMRK